MLYPIIPINDFPFDFEPNGNKNKLNLVQDFDPGFIYLQGAEFGFLFDNLIN